MRNKRGVIAISEILILIIAIFAFVYLINENIIILSAKQFVFVKGTAGGESKIITANSLDEALNKLTDEEKKIWIYSPEAQKAFDTEILPENAATLPVAGATAVPVITSTFNSATGITSLLKGAEIVDGTYVSGVVGKFTATAKNPVIVSGGGTILKQGTERVTYSGVLTATEDVGLKGQISGTGGTSPSGSSFMNFLFKSQTGWKGIVQGATWAATVYFAVKTIGGFLGMEEAKVNAAAMAASGGVFAGKTAYSIAKWGAGDAGKVWGMSPGMWGIGTGIVVTALIFYFMYEKTEQEIVIFECEPWDAPTGGNNCEKCNNQNLPCSLYQCKSLGQACDLVNDETSGQAKCVWTNRKDVDPPIIKPWNDALLEDYKYAPDNTISPPDIGAKIVNKKSTEGCIPAFTPMSFGINTNEPSRCKIDYIRKNNFDEMNFFFGGNSLFSYNHTQIMSLPGPTAETNSSLIIQNDGNYQLFIRCQDANGNSNTANFVFKYCVEKGPDTTPPIIVTTDLLDGMPIAYEQKSIELEVYTNEPATCKWSKIDGDYDNMENDMSCSSSVFEMNAQMLYRCRTTLTGLKDREENKFFFRCKDKPTASKDRNVMRESYKFSLIGTEPLILDWAKPNETIKDSTEIIEITLEAHTSAGYKNGRANCYFSKTGKDEDYTLFLKTDSYEHSQKLNLPEGSYEYYIKCVDLGGNADTKKISFSVETDNNSPIVVRIYKEESRLKIITDEEAECVYDIKDCSYPFDKGISMASIDNTEHFINWDTTRNFYIKCRDNYGNRPIGNECNIIARPFDIFDGGE